MYGIIHRAVRDMVVETRDEATWEALCEHGGFSPTLFEPMDSYPDEQTYGLIITAADHLGMPLQDVLFQFGLYWVRATAPRDYGAIFHMTGTDLFGFLEGLDAMHERVVLSFSQLQMPYFELERINDQTARLHYRSHREGLAPFVFGLLHGLAEHFNAEAQIAQLEDKGAGAEHDVFEITIRGERA